MEILVVVGLGVVVTAIMYGIARIEVGLKRRD